MKLLLAALFALSASAQDVAPKTLEYTIGTTVHTLDAKQFKDLYTRQFRYVDGLVVIKEPAPIEFQYHFQTSNPFPDGKMPGFPSLPPEFDKAGILVNIKNCTGCTKYTVRVTYHRIAHPGVYYSDPRAVEEVTVDRMEPNSNGGDSTHAVVWLGKTRADHQILKVEVEALAVVAKSEQMPK